MRSLTKRSTWLTAALIAAPIAFADAEAKELVVPVVTSNQSTVWLACGRLGVDASGVKAGRLFQVPYQGGARQRSAAAG